MAQRLGAACREARRAAGLRQIDIATAAGVDHSTISRFETGYGNRWREDTDDIVAAYAHELGITPEELWRRALDH
jgi:transcriptional regulator with XRE-family HTH domain